MKVKLTANQEVWPQISLNLTEFISFWLQDPLAYRLTLIKIIVIHQRIKCLHLSARLL